LWIHSSASQVVLLEVWCNFSRALPLSVSGVSVKPNRASARPVAVERVLAAAAHWVDHQRVLPDLGCYEERYRLTGSAALSLAAALLSVGLGLLWHTPVIFTVTAVLLAVVALQGGGAFGAARRMIAFRADHAGITLGAVPGKLTPGHGSAVFVPWADVEQIILYPAYPRGRGGYAQAQCIGIKRRAVSPALPEGNEQAPGCPVPGVAAGATRKITGWRLDHERLAAVAAAVAPGIPIVNVGTGSGTGVKGPGQAASASELEP